MALLFFAMFLPILLIVAAFAVDLSYGHLAKERMKFAADAAAAGAALALPNRDVARQIARMIADANSGDGGTSAITADNDVVLGVYDTDTRRFVPGGEMPNAIQVTASRTAAKGNAMPAFFSGILGRTGLDVAASAVAVQVAPPCVVVLDQNGHGSYTQEDESEVLIPACGVHVNGINGTALEQKGLNLKARTICAVGSVAGTMIPRARTGCASLRDPMLSVPEPAEPDCRQVNPQPGFQPQPNCSYSGLVVLAGTITLAPGLYDFRAAQVFVAPNTRIEGKEVMLFLDKDSSLTIEPRTQVELYPPTRGPYTGLTIYQSRNAHTVTRIYGTGDTNIFGTIYMPSTILSLGGRLGLGKTVVARLTVERSAQVLFNHWMGTNAVPALSATNIRTTIIR